MRGSLAHRFPGAFMIPEADPSPVSADDRYSAGDKLMGKYELKSLIRVGGMGSLWRAHNGALDVDVAVKLIRADVASEEATRRLIQEARAAARIRHANIVRIFELGETEAGDPFIVMEWLEGEDLSERIRRMRRIPPATAVQILLPVTGALGAAHAAGVVHRDLKPENIFLVPGEEEDLMTPKVLDFGIAKLEQTFDQRMTQEGVTMGSPAYMAPEQAKGRRDVGPSADVWATSVVLYEMITGAMPFDGDNYNALMASICDDEPTPILELMAGDAALWAILERGLRKDPVERFPTMRAFGQELARWAADHGVETDVTGAAIGAVWLRASLLDLERTSQPDLERISGVRGSDFTRVKGDSSSNARTSSSRATARAAASPGDSASPRESGPSSVSRRFPIGVAVGVLSTLLGVVAAWAYWGQAGDPSGTAEPTPTVAPPATLERAGGPREPALGEGSPDGQAEGAEVAPLHPAEADSDVAASARAASATGSAAAVVAPEGAGAKAGPSPLPKKKPPSPPASPSSASPASPASPAPPPPGGLPLPSEATF